MTLVERHFDFGSFLCREDVTEEIVIEGWFWSGAGEEGRKGEGWKERKEKKRDKICGGETRGERA